MPSLIIKRGKNRWRASVTVRGVTRQKLFPDNSRRSEKEAIAWEEAERQLIVEDLSKIPMDCCRLIDWANHYLNFAKTNFVKKVYDEKCSVFRRLMATINPEMAVADFSVEAASEFLSKQFKSRSDYAANKDRKNLGAGWKWAKKYMKGFPKNAINVFHAVDKFSEERSLRYIPPEKDFYKVLALTEGQDRVMLLTLLHLAARIREVFRIKMSDLDFDRSSICLWTRKRMGGNLEPDWLPMTRRLKHALYQWYTERLSHPFDSEYLFVCLSRTAFCEQYYGKPFTSRQHMMTKLCKKAQVKKFTFHAIRHLTASILYYDGNGSSDIQKLLRHKNASTTDRYIKSLGNEKLRKSLEKAFGNKTESNTFFKTKKPESDAFGNNLCPDLVSGFKSDC